VADCRQEAPQPDLTTLLLETDFNGNYMTDIDFGSFFVQLVTAGKLKSTDGVYGIRFAHNTDAVVTGLTVTKP
jgi:hypothetical protein